MWQDWLEIGIAVAIAIVGALLLAWIVTWVFRLMARRGSWPTVLVQRGRRPFRVMILVISLWIAINISLPPDTEWRDGINQAFTIAIIGASAWLVGALVYFATDLALGAYRIDVPDNRVARRIRTQMLILRRLAVALLVVIAIGAALLTFPSVRTVGASLLASAGIASVVAGLAAQSVLANLFAGIQLVFSEAIRVDDVLVVEGEWGRVGEITLSYVVLNIWDDRRLVLPCTYFTTTPFENWTRKGSELLGAIELDLDWRVSPTRMRTHLQHVLAGTDLWDGRASVLQVTDATGGMVRVRILVTAKDSPTLFDLRCIVRESMVSWVQQNTPNALPTQRLLITDPNAVRDAVEDPTPTSDGLFTGSSEAEERANEFTQAVPIIRPGDEDEADSAMATDETLKSS
ncbi:small-conductance mechanosensitive channel [Microbacterium halimionae]|uniref:Small-conductance mechanosensitive channel n=1 Tax=Microbacterium halimionae TaxID=1526413 RepID=A0A7W3JM83_9MICO|nr:mechanosensitive ion channel family protein [Microbacterium halimionae]MBA8815314.1 small-conductance mechanosensitive channel [Microbacterium halimionae]NII93895.1 small-conductance mechanosensitive channel [Microbacterium halimionae]